jgi:hypothetical protein
MIKRPNLNLHGVEGAEIQTNVIANLFNEIIRKFLKSWERYGHPSIGGLRTPISTCHIIVTMLRLENKESILNDARGKCQFTYKGKHIRLIPDCSAETQKSRGA